MKTWLFLLTFPFLLVSCADTSPLQTQQLVLNDQAFTAPAQTIDAEQVFAVTPEMKRYLAENIRLQGGKKTLARKLFEALSTHGQIKLEYDAEITRTAAQAFASRSGNCLSLVIMTAALAKELGLDVEYQNVLLQESWSRNNDLYFASGHVNIIIGSRPNISLDRDGDRQALLIDFLPPDELRGQKSELIDENTVLAMYMNNRAAESLAAHDMNAAYWYAREAVRRAPRLIIAYNTLGVIYRQHGDFALAEKVFKQILQREPDNTLALSNLIEVLRKSGAAGEADRYALRLEHLQPYPPFYYFNRGLAAMQKGEYKKAKMLFEKEIQRDPYYDEYHFWLALAYLRLGEIQQAKEQLVLAQKNSTTHQTLKLYTSKLERIKALSRQQ
ncbi:MAG: tetratricopeptide repeat protein [Burkholderiales bacterium]|nr:tetratricopeptide repeat protein [Burkholderiales bacterium]